LPEGEPVTSGCLVFAVALPAQAVNQRLKALVPPGGRDREILLAGEQEGKKARRQEGKKASKKAYSRITRIMPRSSTERILQKYIWTIGCSKIIINVFRANPWNNPCTP
jgi:hypothetical protein